MWIDSDAIVRHCLPGMDGWAQRTVLAAPPEVDLLYGSDGNTGLLFVRTTAWSKKFLGKMLALRHEVEAAPGHCTAWHKLQDYLGLPKRCNPTHVMDQLAFRWARLDPALCFEQHAREISPLQGRAWVEHHKGVPKPVDHMHEVDKLRVRNVSDVAGWDTSVIDRDTPIAHMVRCNFLNQAPTGASCWPHFEARIRWVDADCT